ncbi:putative pectinesterase [Trifolium repens]|nr:putative pectinesterase [Trifolium repens]
MIRPPLPPVRTQETQPAKSRVEVRSDTPLASPPPTPTTDASTSKPTRQPPTLKSTSLLPCSTWSTPNRIGAQTSHTKGFRPARGQTRKECLTHPHLARHTLPKPAVPKPSYTIPDPH